MSIHEDEDEGFKDDNAEKEIEKDKKQNTYTLEDQDSVDLKKIQMTQETPPHTIVEKEGRHMINDEIVEKNGWDSVAEFIKPFNSVNDDADKKKDGQKLEKNGKNINQSNHILAQTTGNSLASDQYPANAKQQPRIIDDIYFSSGNDTSHLNAILKRDIPRFSDHKIKSRRGELSREFENEMDDKSDTKEPECKKMKNDNSSQTLLTSYERKVNELEKRIEKQAQEIKLLKSENKNQSDTIEKYKVLVAKLKKKQRGSDEEEEGLGGRKILDKIEGTIRDIMDKQNNQETSQVTLSALAE
nr:PREDICTED: uncharacterized protein LOC105272917 [Fopius arisanus]